ncbi:hypothetical protein PoB_001729400 [Plakobranchus ocellatus]|uniref:Uncharacterized protein n=1 Tax=Plakobranchus ocellatus TaxID=259542 RepID=A0AAV3ZA13_9GAST|nr:hypothetical protein PoB_001729400 [Plakobranchus ocellatus]
MKRPLCCPPFTNPVAWRFQNKSMAAMLRASRRERTGLNNVTKEDGLVTNASSNVTVQVMASVTNLEPVAMDVIHSGLVQLVNTVRTWGILSLYCLLKAQDNGCDNVISLYLLTARGLKIRKYILAYERRNSRVVYSALGTPGMTTGMTKLQWGML